jgi:hypothetical protein
VAGVLCVWRRLPNAEREDAFADHLRPRRRVLLDDDALLRILCDRRRLYSGD